MILPASIAFTAAIGVLMVISTAAVRAARRPLRIISTACLPGRPFYAVPQVLAATVPVGLVGTQVGTLVKLVRVLMLGPVVVTLSLRHRCGG